MLVLNLQAEHLDLTIIGMFLMLLELLLLHELDFSICLLGHVLLTLVIKFLLVYCIVIS